MAGIFGPGGGVSKAKEEQQNLAKAKEQSAIDPRLRDIIQQQSQTALDYRNNLHNLQKDLGNQSGDEGRSALAQRLSSIKSGASGRGLLYSGLRQAAESGAQTDMASQLAAKRANINSDTEDTALGFESGALQGGLGLQALQQQYQDQAKRSLYGQGLDAYRAKAESQGELFKAGGMLGGSVLAGQMNKDGAAPTRRKATEAEWTPGFTPYK